MLVLATVIMFTTGKQAFAQQKPTTYVSPPVTPYNVNVDLRTLPKAPASVITGQGVRVTGGPTPIGPAPSPGKPDPLWQKSIGSKGGTLAPLSGVTPSQFTTPNPKFEGMTGGGDPPDTNGAVGANHYIQAVNQTSFVVWDKKGIALTPVISFESLWVAGGAPADDDCRVRGRGDPYVTYDHLADRWVLSQLANHLDNTGDPLQVMCIAVTKGANPVTDGWYAYTFQLGVKNDYPKLGVWPDGYYVITQRGYNGGNLDATVYDRANMLNGNPATFQAKSFFNFTGFGGETVIALPSELTGPVPPVGSPNFYVRPVDGDLYGDGSDRIEIWEFHVDWGVPANTTFTPAQVLGTAPFSSSICSGPDLDQDCVPMPGTTDKVDATSIWPRSPVQYRNFGTYETLMLSHVVNVDGAGLSGMRWEELRRTPPGTGSWVIQQQGTFSPTDTPFTTLDSIHRWNGSLDMDKAGNIAMSYNVSADGVGSDVSLFPGIRYVGRLAGDPPGEMTTPETDLAVGTTAKPGGGRWGDYSTTRIDPVDGCTFWVTNMFYSGTPDLAVQDSQIGAFRFPTCNPADLSITKTAPATIVAGNQLSYTITVTNNGTDNATNVVVTDGLPAGVTYVSSSIPCSGVPLTCNVGTLANGASTTFTVQVQVPANFLASHTPNITNTASVTADQLDPNTANNTASALTNVTESADVSVAKVCKPDGTAPAGGSGFCGITVSNAGPSDARLVVLTDHLVSNSTFTVSLVSGGVCTPSTPITGTDVTLTCNLGTVAAGSSTIRTVTVTSSVAGDVNDTATVTSATPDPNTANNVATGRVSFAASANLSITKTSAPNPVIAGTNLTYTITASNVGPSPATNVVVTDTLPGQISVVSATPSVGSCSGGIPGNPAQPLICTLGTLNASGPGSTATIIVVVKVNSSTPDGTILINNGAIRSDTPDPDNSNNVVTALSPVIARGDLAITKTSDKPNYKPNALITFTVGVTNNGASDSLGVVVTDSLPQVAMAIYLSDTGGCTKSGNTLTCNLGNMPVGTSKSFNVLMRVKGNRGTITNTASVASSTGDLIPGNNTAIRSVAVK